MLPTPSTSHVSFNTIYEPSEDSYLFLDTLSSATEAAWLSRRFGQSNGLKASPTPLVVEVGTGSGVVLAFLAAQAQTIFGRGDILTLGSDVNRDACCATRQTVLQAIAEEKDKHREGEGASHGQESAAFLASLNGDLCTPMRPGAIDVLAFNPPYVPTPELPPLPSLEDDLDETGTTSARLSQSSQFERESYLLALSYAGGTDGMETTDRLIEQIPEVLEPDRGVAYVLLCAQNKPPAVIERIRAWGNGWMAEVVGRSGKQAGWEKLVIVRIWRGA